MSHRLDIKPEEIKNMAELRERGYSCRAIASLWGISRMTVRRRIDIPDYRKWSLMNILRVKINGKKHRLRVNKRPYPRACEMCGSKKVHLDWHHWDPDRLEFGLWLCIPCHQFTEGVERGLTVARYMELKEWAKTNARAHRKIQIGPSKRSETLTATDAL